MLRVFRRFGKLAIVDESKFKLSLISEAFDTDGKQFGHWIADDYCAKNPASGWQKGQVEIYRMAQCFSFWNIRRWETVWHPAFEFSDMVFIDRLVEIEILSAYAAARVGTHYKLEKEKTWSGFRFMPPEHFEDWVECWVETV